MTKKMTAWPMKKKKRKMMTAWKPMKPTISKKNLRQSMRTRRMT